MVQLLNSIYLGAATPSDYGKAAGAVELLPFDYYLGAAVPSHGKPTINVLLSGVSPLTLLNAVSLNYIKAFGKCEQASTPTTASNVDIVCNNGTLKVRHQSGLPIGYQAYEYITTNGSKWLNTGVKLTSTDVIETEFKNNSATSYGALYGVFALGQSSAFYANNTYYGYDIANDKVDTGVSVDTAWHTLRQDFSNGIITLDGNDTTYTPFEFENTENNYLFARYYNNSYGYGFKGSCKRFKVFRNGVLICDLIPAIRLSDNAIGMYDLVQNEFRGNLGSGDFTISNQIDDPIEVYYDGTVETVEITKNYLSREGETAGQIIMSDGTVSNNSNYYISAIIKLPAGNYTCNWNQGSGNSRPFSVFKCNSNGDIITTDDGGKLFYETNGIGSGNFTVETETTARISYRYSITSNSVVLLNIGSANCQPLLSVGTYKDVQNITNGAITRNVGVKVLDGTEDWRLYSSTRDVCLYDTVDAYKPASPMAILSTHFAGSSQSTSQQSANTIRLTYGNSDFGLFSIRLEGTSADNAVDELKQFLASQYAAGTPVIVVYPLATPTTDTVAGQTLSLEKGTNTITAEGSVDDLELEVYYKASVEVTVQEIEAVNLDNNVTVEIN